MENRELIRRLQEDHRALKTSIQKQGEALKGLEAYLKYLGATDNERGEELSFPSLQGSLTRRAEPLPPRAYGGGGPVPTNGRPGTLVLAREVRSAVREAEGAEFTQRDIKDRIARDWPNHDVRSGSVHNALSRMANRGEIEKVREGFGNEPDVFREVLHADVVQETANNEDGAVSD